MIKDLSTILLMCGVMYGQQADFAKMDFHRADSIAAVYKEESLRNLPLLAYQLTSSLPTKIEKFRAIYTWVSTNIDNDYTYYLRNKRKREKFANDSLALITWNNSFQSKVFEKLLKEQKTICTGYAYILRELASMVDINCKIIDGYARTTTANISEPGTPNHSWNAVEIDHTWYLCDATWSSGSFEQSAHSFKFIRNYNDSYFLTDPALFSKDHYPLDTAWLLMDSKPELSQFLNAPLIYKNAYDHQVIPLEPKEMNFQVAKNDLITFLCKASEDVGLEDVTVEIVSGIKNLTKKPMVFRNNDRTLSITHKFEILGYYDVHIKIKDDYVASYTVRVKKKNRS
ncbi:hypothetical protein GCM10022393_28780 [Aquimarina addita]|uniref:Transglutaminase-like domain-containing protein n=1 Tax=Aquimarina addita TaxID=870485 RepID=A0ABP6UNB0_9FLAO